MSDHAFITQETFQETPYYDQTWEIVGAPPQELVFTPMEVKVVGDAHVALDPMFRDYGGRVTSDAPSRWHLPPELAAAQSKELEAKKESIVDTRVQVEPAELEQMKAQAHAEGLEKGRSEEHARQQELLASVGGRLQTILESTQAQMEQSIAGLEQAAVSLALAISKKIIGQAVEINPEYIIPVVRDALKLAKGATIKRVRVSPQDFEFFQVVGFQTEIKGFDGTWSFEADPKVESGCIVDCSAGEIDYQLDKAWGRIQDSVLKVLR